MCLTKLPVRINHCMVRREPSSTVLGLEVVGIQEAHVVRMGHWHIMDRNWRGSRCTPCKFIIPFDRIRSTDSSVDGSW